MEANVLLINRYPYWLYDQEGFFMEDTDRLIILHSKEENFDFPKDRFRVAVVCDFRNKEELDRCIAYLYETYKFERVVNVTERFVLLAAEIRDRYRLQGMNYLTALKFRDKWRMKEEVRQAGVRTPHFALAQNMETVQDFYERYGSCVVKPLSGMGSVSTYFVKNPDDFRQLEESDLPLTDAIVEEFIEGDMYHCDSIVENGELQMCSVSRYSRPPAHFSAGRNLSSVMIADSPLRAEMERINWQVLKTLDMRNGVTHLEFFVTPAAEVIFCEVGARAGGAGVIPAIQQVYGINLFKADLRTQMGYPVQPHQSDRCAGWLLIVGQPGIIEDISDESEFDYPWIAYCHVGYRRGDTLGNVKNSTDAVAELTIVGDSEWDVRQKIRFIEKHFRLKITNYDFREADK